MKFKGFDDWIEIFRGGQQTDSYGDVHDGDAIIDLAVETFDTSYHEPPLVIGHPKHDDPAYGWVEELKKTVKDGTKVLLAKFKDVVPEFIDATKSGRYKKRSASFYSDGRLRHVGILGAVPPAVKGLTNVAFSDDPGISFEFAETSPWTWEAVARIFRRLREYIIEKDNKETADAIIPDWDVENIRDEATKTQQKESDTMKFTEFLEALKIWKKLEKDPDADVSIPANGPAPGAKTFTEADIEAAKEQAAKKERKKADADFAEKEAQDKRKAQNKEISDFCDALVADKKIPPSWAKAGLVEFMQGLDSEKEISFDEGEDKKSSLKWFKDFLEGFEKSPIFKEMATKESAGGGSEFAEAEKDKKIGESIAAKVK